MLSIVVDPMRRFRHGVQVTGQHAVSKRRNEGALCEYGFSDGWVSLPTGEGSISSSDLFASQVPPGYCCARLSGGGPGEASTPMKISRRYTTGGEDAFDEPSTTLSDLAGVGEAPRLRIEVMSDTKKCKGVAKIKVSVDFASDWVASKFLERTFRLFKNC